MRHEDGLEVGVNLFLFHPFNKTLFITHEICTRTLSTNIQLFPFILKMLRIIQPPTKTLLIISKFFHLNPSSNTPPSPISSV